MGRKRKNHVYAYFTYERETNSSKCDIEGCNKVLKGNHGTNLLHHLSSKHVEEYNMVMKYNNLANDAEDKENCGEGTSNAGMKTAKMCAMQECLNLVTVHGRPFELLDDSAFRNIIKLIPMNAREYQSFNSHNIKSLVQNKADAIRSSIRQEARNQLLSVKVDCATRLDRSFFGINIQYVREAKIIIRHLGVVEMHTRSTAEFLKEKLLWVLRKYYIETKQVYSITTDNGSNMIKLIKLINDDLLQSTEETMSEQDESDTDDEGAWTDLTPPISSITTEEGLPYTVLPVRCAAHTLQLAINDALNNESNCLGIIRDARVVVRTLRTPTFLNILRTAQKRKPVLDCSTRWHSTIDMLESLLNLKDCCSTDPNNILYLSEVTWESIQDIVKTLLPARILAKRLQQEQLTFTDFYCVWMKCTLEIEKNLTPLATHLSITMKERQQSLLNEKSFLMAMYLDGRVNVVLSSAEIDAAIQHLKDLWKHIESVCVSEIDETNRNASTSQTQENQQVEKERDEFEAMLTNTGIIKQRLIQQNENGDIESILREFITEPRIPSSINILEYWEGQKLTRPKLYALSKVALAVPATQVSVERLFSSLRFVMERLRYNLNDTTVENILVIRNNNKK